MKKDKGKTRLSLEYSDRVCSGLPDEIDRIDVRKLVAAAYVTGHTRAERARRRWISVDGELPKDSVDILIKRANSSALVKGYYLSSDNSFYCEYIPYPLQFVTHWRYVE
jgi:hypothetical protein